MATPRRMAIKAQRQTETILESIEEIRAMQHVNEIASEQERAEYLEYARTTAANITIITESVIALLKTVDGLKSEIAELKEAKAKPRNERKVPVRGTG